MRTPCQRGRGPIGKSPTEVVTDAGCPPKGPNLERNQARLKFSSELEIFKRATHQTPIFCGEFWRLGLKISSDLEIFKRD